MNILLHINKLLYKLSIILNRRVYSRKVAAEESLFPNLFKSVSAETEQKHIALWAPVIGNVNTRWLRHYCTMSGQEDYRFLPEDVFFVVLERVLNDCAYAGSDVEDKNRYCFFVPEKYLPTAIVRYDRGTWFDNEFLPLTLDQAQRLLMSGTGRVVGKPASGSCGGDNVKVYKRSELNLADISKRFQSYVVQELLVQEPGMASFNPDSVNTLRIMTLRRPWSGRTSVIATMCRFGCGDNIVDNLAAGGVCVDVSLDGILDDKAIGHDCGKVSSHPVTGKKFGGYQIPYYKNMCDACVEVAMRVPGFNILSFDVIARPDGRPCIVEINAKTQGVEQMQMRRPLFGEETEQVRNWCVEHIEFAKRKCLNFS